MRVVDDMALVHALPCGVTREASELHPGLSSTSVLWRLAGDAFVDEPLTRTPLPTSSGTPALVGRWPHDLWLVHKDHRLGKQKNQFRVVNLFYQWENDAWVERRSGSQEPGKAVDDYGSTMLPLPEGGAFVPMQSPWGWEPERQPWFVGWKTGRVLPSLTPLRPPREYWVWTERVPGPVQVSYSSEGYAVLPGGDLVVALLTCSDRDKCILQLGHIGAQGRLDVSSFNPPPGGGTAFLANEGSDDAINRSKLLATSAKGVVYVPVVRKAMGIRNELTAKLTIYRFVTSQGRWSATTIDGPWSVHETRAAGSRLWLVTQEEDVGQGLHWFDGSWHDANVRGLHVHVGALDDEHVWASQDDKLLRLGAGGSFEPVPLLEDPHPLGRYITAISPVSAEETWVKVSYKGREWLLRSPSVREPRVCHPPGEPAAK